MSDFDMFPVDERLGLTADQVAAELTEHQALGYRVTRSADGKCLVLTLDEANEIRVTKSRFQVQGYRLSSIAFCEDARDLAEFRRALDAVARGLIGGRWGHRPVSGRTAVDTPASNFATIAGLVGTSKVVAIHDPYLDHRGLLNLATAISFGVGGLADPIRALATTHTTSGPNPRLTKAGFDAWLAEHAIDGEARVTASGAHRRFLLLDSGGSLIVGQSWNQLHKDEAVRLEDGVGDRAFFDAEWALATPLM